MSEWKVTTTDGQEYTAPKIKVDKDYVQLIADFRLKTMLDKTTGWLWWKKTETVTVSEDKEYTFAIFPAWLNPNNPYVIAPKYWARHNVSTGYWANSSVDTFGFRFLDRNGVLS